MHGHRVSTVDAYTAHREGARRPPDERYVNVEHLYDAARTRRRGTEERLSETGNLHVQPVAADPLAIGDRHRQTSARTHWSFEQLSGVPGAPRTYRRTLP